MFEPLDEVTKKAALQGGKNFAVHYLPIGGDPKDTKVIITEFEPDIQSDTNVYVQLDEEGASSIQLLNCSCLIEVLGGDS
jgi:hypothetical protein